MKKRSKAALSFILMLLLFFALPVQARAEGEAPVAENLELQTYRNVSVGGQLAAFDPDGDLLGFTITTEPVKGELTVREDGSFLYTPRSDRRGRDYFGYKAYDAQGQLSQEATVIIRIEKQKKAVSYRDMRGSADEYAAVALSELGLFTGARLGGGYCFEPEEPVSRGAFIQMCLQLTDTPAYAGVYRTGYADDEQIPEWLRGCAAVAWTKLDGGSAQACFDAEAPVSRAEAALLLDRALGLAADSLPTFAGDTDAELLRACASLKACQIPAQAERTETLTRRDAARLLSAAAAVLARR